MSVTVEVSGGPTTTVTWTSGMNAQQALQLAEDNLKAAFIYSIEYYGSSLGYLVNMINETYDTFQSNYAPFFYWEFLVNGTPAQQGVDSTTLHDGDVVTFTFTAYQPQSQSPTMNAKHDRRTQGEGTRSPER